MAESRILHAFQHLHRDAASRTGLSTCARASSPRSHRWEVAVYACNVGPRGVHYRRNAPNVGFPESSGRPGEPVNGHAVHASTVTDCEPLACSACEWFGGQVE